MKTFDQSDKYNRYNRLDFFFIFASMLKRKPTNNVSVQQLLFLPLNAPLKNKKKIKLFLFLFSNEPYTLFKWIKQSDLNKKSIVINTSRARRNLHMQILWSQQLRHNWKGTGERLYVGPRRTCYEIFSFELWSCR